MTTRTRLPEQHPAVCTACNASTSVPFLPNPDKPVYCGSCFRSRRYRPPAPAKPAANEPVAEDEYPDGPGNAVDSVFPGMALKAATRRAIAQDGHLRAHTHSGKVHPAPAGGPRPDRSGAHGVRQDPRVRRPHGGKVRPVGPADPGPCARAHAGAGHSGGRGHRGPRIIAAPSRDVTVRRPVVGARVHSAEERCSDHHRHPGTDAGPHTPGHPRPAIGPVHGAR